MKLQYSKGKVPKQAHVAIPEGLYEEEHGRQGFFGPVSQFYRLHPPTDWQRIEGPLQPRGPIGFPERGGIGHYAPFDYDVIETPEPEPVTEQRAEWELRVRRRGEYTSVFYDFCPLDVVGWKGTHSVFKLNVKDFRPLM